MTTYKLESPESISCFHVPAEKDVYIDIAAITLPSEDISPSGMRTARSWVLSSRKTAGIVIGGLAGLLVRRK